MNRVRVSFTRSLFAILVVVTLTVPATYAAPRDRDSSPVQSRIVRVIKRVIAIVMGDDMSEPKPTPPSTTTT